MISRIESHLPACLWKPWGVIVAPIRLWQWSTRGSWCWRRDGTREPLAFRFGIAATMVRRRYFDSMVPLARSTRGSW
jgi:hypothetical protein